MLPHVEEGILFSAGLELDCNLDMRVWNFLDTGQLFFLLACSNH